MSIRFVWGLIKGHTVVTSAADKVEWPENQLDYSDSCGLVPVPETQLPVELPDAKGLDLKPKGTSPLGAASDWVNVSCPKCKAPAKRDADTMDTFVDSSWYFLRYTSVNNHEMAFDKKSVETWLPVDQYVGGVTHAILHLLYSRFFTKV